MFFIQETATQIQTNIRIFMFYYFCCHLFNICFWPLVYRESTYCLICLKKAKQYVQINKKTS